jgi:hypothetical protein
MAPPLPAHGVHHAVFSKKSVIKNKPPRLGQGGSDRNDPAAERNFLSSVQCAGRRHVSQLTDCVGDPAPCRLTVEIVVCGQFVGARGALLEGLVAVPLEHQRGGTPDVDLGYHVRNQAGSRDRGCGKTLACRLAHDTDQSGDGVALFRAGDPVIGLDEFGGLGRGKAAAASVSSAMGRVPIAGKPSKNRNSASPPSTVSIRRPCAVVVSDHASPSERKPAFLAVIAASVFNRSRVNRASRSSRVTIHYIAGFKLVEQTAKLCPVGSARHSPEHLARPVLPQRRHLSGDALTVGPDPRGCRRDLCCALHIAPGPLGHAFRETTVRSSAYPRRRQSRYFANN